MGIAQVSQRAGVSPATVSRVFNAPEKVRPALRERVLQAADDLRWTPDASARTLRTRKSRSLGVLLPTLLNPVFAECLNGIAEAALAGGYTIQPAMSDYDPAREAEALKALLARKVDGLILCLADASRPGLRQQLAATSRPCVLAYNRHPQRLCVSVDGQAAMAMLVRRLLDLGHRRIVMVSGALAQSDRAQQRHAGYAEAMAGAGLAPRTVELPFMATGAEAIGTLLAEASRPSALVCSNDLIALRCIRAARLAGLSVPRDLSVTGFDGISLGVDLMPRLGTLVQPSADIGRHSVGLLLRMLADGRPLGPEASLTLPLHFQAGESMAPPADA